jgi:hypothetical protein
MGQKVLVKNLTGGETTKKVVLALTNSQVLNTQCCRRMDFSQNSSQNCYLYSSGAGILLGKLPLSFRCWTVPLVGCQTKEKPPTVLYNQLIYSQPLKQEALLVEN